MSDQSTLDELYALASAESSLGYLKFLSHVVVDAQPRKLVFRLIAERWQWERAMRVSPAIDSLAGIVQIDKNNKPITYNGPRWFWNGYHKGSDKTHETARQLCFLLGWSTRRLNIVVCAGTEDQASLITKAMRGICADNPWISERIQCTDLKATGSSGSELTVLTKNAYTQSGAFPDMIVVEELTHWQHEESRLFWESFILGSINKRPYCVVVVSTNAGLKGSWQWKERNRIEKSKYWSFYEAPVGKPLPSWMDNDKIADAAQGMMPGERDRLYKNRWVDPGEEHGYLTEAEALLCRDNLLQEKVKGEPWVQYYLVLDYGGVHDRCALGIMHVETYNTYDPLTKEYDLKPNRVIVDRLDCWQGTHDNRIDILKPHPNIYTSSSQEKVRRSVQEWIDVSLKNFNVTAIILDPAQLEGLAIFYESQGRRVIRFGYMGGKSNYMMMQILKTSIQNRLVSWSSYAGRLPDSYMENGRLTPIEDVTLEQELSQLIIKPMSYGYRFDHESGRHDDRCLVGDTIITTKRGNIPIREVTTNDLVLTRYGYYRVIWSGTTGQDKVIKVQFSNGVILNGTVNHPVMLTNGEWIPLGKLSIGDKVWSLQKQSSTVEEYIGDIQNQKDGIIGYTSNVTTPIKEKLDISIEINGSTKMEQYLKGMIYTIKIIILLIMIFLISNVSLRRNIQKNIMLQIYKNVVNGYRPRKEKNILKRMLNVLVNYRKILIEKILDLRLPKIIGKIENKQRYPVRYVKRSSLHHSQNVQNIVQTLVTKDQDILQTSIKKKEYVPSVEKNSFLIDTEKPSLVEVHVLQVLDNQNIGLENLQTVYNLTISEHHEFFANGILTHNCIVLGMGLLHAFPEGVPLSVGPESIPNPQTLHPVLGDKPHSPNPLDNSGMIMPDSIAGAPYRWNLFGMKSSGSNWDDPN